MFSTGSFWATGILLGHVLYRFFLDKSDSFGSCPQQVLFGQQWFFWVILSIGSFWATVIILGHILFTGSFWATVIILGHVFYRFFLSNSDYFGSCSLQVLFGQQWFFWVMFSTGSFWETVILCSSGWGSILSILRFLQSYIVNSLGRCDRWEDWNLGPQWFFCPSFEIIIDISKSSISFYVQSTGLGICSFDFRANRSFFCQ